MSYAEMVPTTDIYLRLSDLRHEEALDGREAKLRAEAARIGWTVNRVVIENDAVSRNGRLRPASAFKRAVVRDKAGNRVIDPDTGRPVTRVIRPGWQSVIADLKTGRASAVLAEDLDRACRDPRDLEDLLDACELKGASARSLSGSLALSSGGTDSEKFMARVMVAQAHKASADTSRRTRDAKQRFHGQSYNGGLRPFGYAHVQDTEKYHRTLMIVPDEADMLREAARDILDRDISLHAVTREWRARGSVTVTGKQWTTQKLRQVLLKPAIAGLAALHGYLKDAPWEPVLDRDVWERLRDKLLDPGRKTTTGNEPRHLLSGIARCGICDDGSTVYATGTHLAGGPGYVCPHGGMHLRRNCRHADEFVSRVIVDRLSQADAADLLKPPPRPAGVNAPALRAEAKNLRERKARQMKLHAAGDIDDADLALGMREIRDRLAVIDAQLARSDQPDPLEEFRGKPAEVVWNSLPLARKRAVIRLLMTVTFLRTTRRGPGFDPDSLVIQWR